ncbi:Carboxypeptidase M [Orchesella cincta]|uniref:Carboxypeptidase M n=1 Tax=Orchesella cincta TaxID=48709 RepID=A0A1D2MXH9_ORCCI|nr:Carboxypeptidase M [Orchesella cincta]
MCVMKPATWYISMLIVAFLYIYLTAIQYIRGEELPNPQTVRQSLHARAVREGFGGSKFLSKQGPVNGPSLRFEYHNYDDLTSYLRNHLVTQYPRDEYARWLLENTRIHIMPSMNPDGYEVSKEGTCEGAQGRYNARGYDLNRNFPDFFKTNNARPQMEMEHVKEWLSKIQFVLSGNFHGGALVASYPFDNSAKSMFQSLSSTESVTPDDDTFKHLATIYSTNHKRMYQGRPCKGQNGFKNGITNGAKWYPLIGGMQDFNYIWHGCMEITLEISCCKFPLAEDLERYWRENKESLLRFLGEAHRGVRGFVHDEFGNPIEGVGLKIKDRDVGFKTTRHGEYWRILLPGRYVLEAYHDNYDPKEAEFYVVDDRPTLLNVTLSRNSARTVFDTSKINFPSN